MGPRSHDPVATEGLHPHLAVGTVQAMEDRAHRRRAAGQVVIGVDGSVMRHAEVPATVVSDPDERS